MITRYPNLLTATLLMLAIYLSVPAEVLDKPFWRETKGIPSHPIAKLSTPPPDLKQLFETANHAKSSSSATQRNIEREQIQDALRLAQSPQAEDRRVGIEQLGAYPSSESEDALIRAFRDRDSGVREAAANSLGLWPSPGDRLVNALFVMARQKQEPQKSSALETLSSLLLSGNSDPRTRQTITRGFRQLLAGKVLNAAQRQRINEVLAGE